MRSKEEQLFLQSYDITKYDRPSVTVDVAAFSIRCDEAEDYKRDSEQRLSLLLIKRGEHPFKGCWALPGGFLHSAETLEQCAMREITAESGITPTAIMPSGVFSENGRDPRGWVISHSFVSVMSGEEIKAVGGDDAADAKWFDFSFRYQGELLYLDMKCGDIGIHSVLREKGKRFGVREYDIVDDGGLSFDHAKMIGVALGRLQSAVNNYEVLFDFLPQKFTLAHLQRVQEAILNVTLTPANFRRKVLPFVKETDESTAGAGHRPAKLFVKNTTCNGGN